MDITPHHHPPTHERRTLRALVPVVLGLALLVTALAGPAAAGSASTSQPLVVRGAGQVTGQLPFCPDGSPGPCGRVIEGTVAGTPMASGSFFALIDDGIAGTPDRCAPATYSGVLGAGSEDSISQTATGRICPDGAGGLRFTGRLDASTGTGRFREVSGGRGSVIATMAADGVARLTLVGVLRLG